MAEVDREPLWTCSESYFHQFWYNLVVSLGIETLLNSYYL